MSKKPYIRPRNNYDPYVKKSRDSKEYSRSVPRFDSTEYDPKYSKEDFSSFVKSSARWMDDIPMRQFDALFEDYYRNMHEPREFEFRIGKIKSERFNSGVSEENWKSFLVSICKQPWDSQTDWQYHRNIIFDNQERLSELSNSNSIATMVKKSKLAHPIDVHCSGMHDFRIALAKESPLTDLHDLNAEINLIRYCKRKTMNKNTNYGVVFQLAFTIVLEGETKETALKSEPIYEIELELQLLRPVLKDISFDEFYIRFKMIMLKDLEHILDAFLNPTLYKKIAPLPKLESPASTLDPLHGIEALLDFFTQGKSMIPFLQEKKEIDLIAVLTLDYKLLETFSFKFFSVQLGNDSAKRIFAMSSIRMEILASFESFFEDKASFGSLIQESRKISGTSSTFRFPGSLPANLLESDLEMIQKSSSYRVLWKTNGIRGLIFMTIWKDPKSKISHRLCLFINRSLQMFSILVETGNQNLFKGTIFDGELVLNQKTNRYEFQIFDCLAFEGQVLRKKPYFERISQLASFLKSIKGCATFDWVQKSFICKQADLQTSPTNFATDGFILIDTMRPYYSGQDQFLFKWKPVEHTTVDFLVNICASDLGAIIKLFLIDSNRRFKQVISFSRSNEWNYLACHERIVECYLKNGKWVPIHIREDKPMPNNISTFERTMKGIQQDLQIQDWCFASLFD